MKIYKRLLKYLRPYRVKLGASLVAMSGVAALTALTMYLIKTVLDRVLIARDIGMFYKILFAVPTLFILKGFLSYIQNYWMAIIGHRVIADIRKQMFEHMQTLSIDYFGARSTGKILARFTNDLSALQTVISRCPVYFIRDGLTAVGLVVVLIKLSWRFTLITLCILPLSALVIWLLGKALRRTGRKGQTQMGELYNALQENIQSTAVVKAYNAERLEASRFDVVNQRSLDLSIRFARTDTLSSPLMESVGALIGAFLLWRGGMDVINGVWTAGSFFAFMAAALSTYRPLKNFAELNAQVQLGAASAERIFEVLDERSSIQESPRAILLPSFAREIIYENVSFRYPSHGSDDSTDPKRHSDRPWALRNFNLRVARGEVVALVGSSGSGKTTTATLLPRFYDPTEGKILIDGTDVRDVTLASLRQQIGLVTQDVLLFNESIRYNIAYGKLGASTEEITSAAQAANAHDFILRLPQGYDTVIGERGLRLSGGERQRLSIARALLKNPAILILDEATSALDAESERLVQEALERLMAHRTALVIAHRLATIRKASRIVVMDQGQVVEEGDHQMLLNRQGAYHRLHTLQVLQ